MKMVGDMRLTRAIEMMQRGGLSDPEIAAIIQNIHTWATRTEFFRVQEDMSKNTPPSPHSDEFRALIKA